MNRNHRKFKAEDSHQFFYHDVIMVHIVFFACVFSFNPQKTPIRKLLLVPSDEGTETQRTDTAG